MIYLLDTDVIINHLRRKEKIREAIIRDGVSISIITLGELLYGASKSANRENGLQATEGFLKEFTVEILPLSTKIMHEYARVKTMLETKGNRLDEFDLLIAATAKTHKLTLLTRNLNHFKRIPDLHIA